MSEQNSLARAYSSDMADNDPLAELARIVAGEAPPPPPIRRSVVTPTLPKAPPVTRQAQPEARVPESRPVIPPVRGVVAPPPIDLEDALLAELGLAESPAKPVASAPPPPAAPKPAMRAATPVKPAPQKAVSLEDQLMAELGLDDGGYGDNSGGKSVETALDMDEIERALAFEPAPQQPVSRPVPAAARMPVAKPVPVARTAPVPVATPDPDEFEAILNADMDEQSVAERKSARPLPLTYEADALDEGLAAAIRATQPPADPIKAFDFGSAFEAEVKHLGVAVPPAPPPPPVISAPRPKAAPVRTPVAAAPPPAFELPEFEEPKPAPAPRVMTERDLDEHFASAFAEELELGLAPRAADGGEMVDGTPSMIIDESAFEAALDFEASLAAETEDAQTVKQAYRARAEHLHDDPSFDPVLGQMGFDPAQDWGSDPAGSAEPAAASGSGTASVRVPGQARSIRLAAGALVCALLLGTLAVTYGYFSGGDNDAGEPVVVRADDGPVKVKPENPGGAEIANQDQAAYDKVSGETAQTPSQEKLVTASEQPVEIAKAVEDPAPAAEQPAPVTGETTQAVPADGKTEQRLVPGTETAAATQVPALAPRRVKTLSIKPDGTVVQPVDAPEAPATQETAFAPVEQGSTLPGVEVGTTAVPQQGEAEETAAPATRSLGTTETPTQTASVAAETAAAVGGEWAVQLASQRSAEEAQSTYQNLKRKFPAVLDGKPIAVQRAEVSGKGVFYRVRVPTQTKEEAVALCDELKAAGGSCFIAR